MGFKHVIVILFTACSTFTAVAQKRAQKEFKFSDEDMREFLLYESKRQKTKGIVALISGPALAALGFHIIQKNKYFVFDGSSVSSGYHDGAAVGYLLSTVGVSTTISSFVLFGSSAKLKKRARRFSADPSADH